MNEEKKENLNPEIKPSSKDKKDEGIVKRIKVNGRVPTLDLVLLVRHFSTLLKSSLPIEDALNTIIDQTVNPKLKKVFQQILIDVQNGDSIAKAMEQFPKIFPRVVISIIRAGEEGGTLEKNLIYLADYLKNNYKLKKKLQAAMFYPLMVIGITILELLGVIFFVLPQLDSLFKSFPNVPQFTKILLSTARFVNHNFLWISLGIVFAGILVFFFFKTKMGKIVSDWLKLNFPVIKSLTVASILTNFSRTLGILLESAIPLSAAMKIAAETIDNNFYGKVLLEVRERIKVGDTLADSLEKYPKLFPLTFVKMIDIGEKTGALEEDLLYMHEFYNEEVNDISNNIATLIEPILLVFIGIMVAFLAISIVVPIYQLTSSIN